MANNIPFQIWWDMMQSVPKWEWIIGLFAVCWGIILLCLYELFSLNQLSIFHAFEKLKFRKQDIEKELGKTIYFEVVIPRESQASAFQVQQKILKAFHSIYNDPVAGKHQFSKSFYFLQKLFRSRKVRKVPQLFFALQTWAQYPYISFRLSVPIAFFTRVEKAIFNAYPNAEITTIDKSVVISEVAKFQQSYLCYGETKIEGDFYHRIKTFKDFSSDPIDSITSTMEGILQGKFMVYNVVVSPASHYFNQVIHYLIEDQEKNQGYESQNLKTKTPSYKREYVSQLNSSVTSAMAEKMKSSLFHTVVSYWTVADTEEEAENNLANIQSVLTEVNQKNMNTLVHTKLFTKQIEELERSGDLRKIIECQPILKYKNKKRLFFGNFKNYSQILADSEVYSLWHLPNITNETVTSVKTLKYKKLQATHDVRSYEEPFFVNLGNSNFRMQETTPIGIPTWDDMKKHLYILGGTGSGKSETLKTILQNILNKDGKEKTACLIIDPKNDFATDLLTMIPEHRKNDVVYFNPTKQKDKPLGFPFFSQFSGDKNSDERIEFLISIMKRFVQVDSAYSWGPELENILRNLFATAYFLPEQSLSGLDLLFHEPEQIKNITKFLPARLQKFWTDSILKRTNNDLAKYLATTNNKLGKFLDYPEFMNIADRLDAKITFEEMINTGKIFIANLGSSSEQMKKYYSVYLTAHITEAIFGQARLASEDRKPAVFVVDEFQRVASDIFETLFSEVRAFNTALVISNQFMGQLDERIKKSIESNISTKIFMRTQSMDDAEIAVKILGSKVVVEDIINLPTGTAYMKTLVQGFPQDAMSIQITKTSHPSGISKDLEDFYSNQTADLYGTPLEVIKHKRDAINNIYYTGNQPQIFSEQMSRANNAHKVELVAELPKSVPPGNLKSIFDY